MTRLRDAFALFGIVCTVPVTLHRLPPSTASAMCLQCFQRFCVLSNLVNEQNSDLSLSHLHAFLSIWCFHSLSISDSSNLAAPPLLSHSGQVGGWCWQFHRVSSRILGFCIHKPWLETCQENSVYLLMDWLHHPCSRLSSAALRNRSIAHSPNPKSGQPNLFLSDPNVVGRALWLSVRSMSKPPILLLSLMQIFNLCGLLKHSSTRSVIGLQQCTLVLFDPLFVLVRHW